MRISENIRSQGGFTLIEMLIAMAMGTIVLAGIYGAYQDQLRTSITQQQLVDMNQNLRVAMYVLERDLRMSGANPTGNPDAGFLTMEADELVIAMDDGGTDNLASNTNNALGDSNDNDGDGTVDDADEWYDGDTTDQGEVVRYDLDSGNLRRWFNSAGSGTPTNAEWLAQNIDFLDFTYLDGANPPALTADPEEIRYVQVTIVARSGDYVPVFMRKHTDNKVYRNPLGTRQFTAPGDQFRRVMVSTTIKCRNMGL